MADIQKKTKHVRYAAPDFGAVFAKIAEIVRQETEDLVILESWKFYKYLKAYIRENKAQPEEATPRKGRIIYERRKMREGFGNIQLIRTERYIDSIELRPIAISNRKSTRTTKGGVRVNPDAVTPDGLSLQKLANLLEYGYVKARSSRRGSQKERGAAFTRIPDRPARPHWRPAVLWYKATRRANVPKNLAKRIQKRLKADLKWL